MLGLGTTVGSSSSTTTFGEVSPFSLSLDGADDRVTLSREITLDVDGAGSDGTIAFWSKRVDSGGRDVILGAHAEVGNINSNFDTKLEFTADPKLAIETTANGQEAKADVTDNDDWHHYAVTWNGQNGTDNAQPIIYQDGIALTTAIGNFGQEEDADLIFDTIGAVNNTSNGDHEFKGLLYQLAVWNVTLDAASIKSIYNTGAPIPLELDFINYDNASDLVHLYKFEEGIGTATEDAVGAVNGKLKEQATYSTTVPVFLPNLLGNAVVWLKRNTNITADENSAAGSVTHSTSAGNMAESDRVNAWNAFTGTSINAVQTTSVDKPRFEFADPNDLGALNFKAGLKYMDLSANIDIAANTDFTLALRFKAAAFNTMLIGHDANEFIKIIDGDTIRVKTNGTTSDLDTTSGKLLSNEKYVTMIIVRSGGSDGDIDIFMRGTDLGYFDANAEGTAWASTVQDAEEIVFSNLGSSADDTQNFRGFISDLIVLDGTAVTAQQRAQIYDYIEEGLN